MSAPFRSQQGGRIDRSRPIGFTFDGVAYSGCVGDTLASALIANGVHLVGRSFKYHRPRGILSAGAEEPNALVTVDRGAGRVTPNLRATQVELTDGLVAKSQNCWPSLGFDVGVVNDWAWPVLPSGFYYKTFMGPAPLSAKWAWNRLYEPFIRRAAGLGEPPAAPDPDAYAQYYAHCDVLVVGAGPAGLAAALEAARSGASVLLCDEQAEPGGSLLAEDAARIDGEPAQAWLARALAELQPRPNVRVMPRTLAFGYYAQNFLGLVESVGDGEADLAPDAPRERLWQVRAKEVVLACGAIERPLVFPDNDRPGIMLADAARVYLARYGAKVGERIALVAAHDGAYRAALALKDAGVGVAAILDLRPAAPGALPERARQAGLTVRTGVSIAGVRGRRRVEAVGIGAGDTPEWIACDALLMSGGWTPSLHLQAQSRAKPRYDEARGLFLPGSSVQRERSAGACAGTFSLAGALSEGAAAGADAAQRAGFLASAHAYAVEGDEPASQEPGFAGDVSPASAVHKRAFVDFQNDVCAKDIRLAAREGMRSIEHVKRYTTTGMATDQGKTSNVNALTIAAAALGEKIPAVGLTTYRPPYTPVTFGAFAGPQRGDLFDPMRRTAIHDWAAGRGAKFEDVGLWKRAWYFPRPGEGLHAAVARECKGTRASVGLFDASTLGKIEVVGPDAATFLERLYTNPFAKLEVGRCRYGLMLNEQGFVMDDGVVARLAPDRFHVTTTTGGAARVLHHMEDYLQTEFPELKVWLTSTSEQWATIAVQGPRARDLVAPFVDGLDLSAPAFPHMSVRDAQFAGLAARIMRVSFTGELGFEINLPPGHARAAWEALWEAGKAYEAVAYGTEAMHVMRAEKGYIIVGQETDGTVTPSDLGLDWAIGKAKKDFVGKRSLARPDILAPNRKQLVGLLTDDPTRVLEEGAQIVATAKPSRGAHALGHVTSSYFSPALSRSMALALVENGRGRMGETLFSPMPGGDVPVKVVAPVFYDKEGARLHG